MDKGDWAPVGFKHLSVLRRLLHHGPEGSSLTRLEMWAKSSRDTETAHAILDHVEGGRGARLEPVTYGPLHLVCAFYTGIYSICIVRCNLPPKQGLQSKHHKLLLDPGPPVPRWMRIMPSCSHKGGTGKCSRDPHSGDRTQAWHFQLLMFCFVRTVRHRFLFCFVSPYEILESLALIGNQLKHCAGQTKYICKLSSIFWLTF